MSNYFLSKLFGGCFSIFLKNSRALVEGSTCVGLGCIEMGHSILWGKGQFIIWETRNSIPWERFSENPTTYPLGIGTSSGKLDVGNGQRHSLGFGPLILWETAIWEMRYNP